MIKKVLNSCCILVKGAERSIIIDVQRKAYYWLENKYVVQLESGEFSDVELYKFMEENELLIAENKNFRSISMNYDSPDLINNILMDYDSSSTHNLVNSIKKLSKLKCKHYEIRMFSEFDISLIEDLIDLLNNINSCISFELVIKNSIEITDEWLKHMVLKYVKIKSITVHSYYKDKILCEFNEITRFEMGNIYYTKQCISDEHHCGYVSQEYFSFKNIKSIVESYSRNNCLNQKLSIDKKGFIRNCPAMKDKYGKLEDLSLPEIKVIILSENFRKIWYLSKDKVKTCMDCEFRYICSDCRAHTLNNELYEKPLHCKYDPYEKN